MIGTLKLSTNFSRFGFVVPRSPRRNSQSRLTQLHRSSRSRHGDGLMVAHDRTTSADTRIASINIRVTE